MKGVARDVAVGVGILLVLYLIVRARIATLPEKARIQAEEALRTISTRALLMFAGFLALAVPFGWALSAALVVASATAATAAEGLFDAVLGREPAEGGISFEGVPEGTDPKQGARCRDDQVLSSDGSTCLGISGVG